MANAPPGQRKNVEFTQARAEFTRTPGRTMIRDGVVKGPMIGATMEGLIDYARDELSVRGTLVPLYGLNNMFGQLPIVGAVSRRRQQRGPARHHLRSDRLAEQSATYCESDFSNRAGPAAQIVRIPRHQRPRLRRAAAVTR